MPNRRNFPVARARRYKQLAARLAAVNEEIQRQGRTRPLAEVPPGAARTVGRLLAECRRFSARGASLPAVTRGKVTYADLTLVLGEAVFAFTAFGARHHLDRPEPGSTEALMASAREDMQEALLESMLL